MRNVQDNMLRPLQSDEVNEVAGGFFAIRFPAGESQTMSLLQNSVSTAIKGIGEGLASVARK